MSSPRGAYDGWDCMLPGPPSRSNGGCADCSPHGLLAYGAGSSVAVVDPRSMQLVFLLPMPAPSPSSLSPFVTSLRFSPHPPLPPDLADDDSAARLLLSAGDRQGRVALWDLRSRSVVLFLASETLAGDKAKLGVQDLCWVRSGPAGALALASLHGPSLLALWDPVSGRCFWKYDAVSEYFSCIRRDPFDARHFCALGVKGFLLSAKVVGMGEDGVAIEEHQIPVSAANDSGELQRLEKEAAAAGNPNSPALAVFPMYFVRCTFSPRWKNLLFVTFPKELVVFDLQYGTSLSSMALPRGCAKLMDVVADPDLELVYCAHVDGKLSAWKRKE